MGERGQGHHGTVGEGGQSDELVRTKEAALVEEGMLGGGDDGAFHRTEGHLGRGRRTARSGRRGWAGGGRRSGRTPGSWWSRRPR